MSRNISLVFVLFAVSALAQDVALQPIATGLDQPVALTHAGDTRLFITEQTGTIRIYDALGLRATPFLDIRSIVLSGGERGLLSVAFHPQYRDNGLFFVYYTNRNGDNNVARYKVTSDPDRADPASGTILLTIPHPTFANHNGGQLQFGPDGFLYIGTGDGGSGGDPNNNAQNLNQLLGKILRIDVDHGLPYTIPPSNPFATRPGARGEIWAYGVRNPWRFSFDRVTGDLWIGDVGQDAFEEVDFQPATSIGGENYGWRKMEGQHCYNPSSNCVDPGVVFPLLEYSHAGGACSISGGYRYRGTQIASLKGAYLYGDYCTGTIFKGTQFGTNWSPSTLLATTLRISAFGEDLSGELYVMDVARGIVYKILPRGVVRRRAVR
ncbi:MAG: PQQ-dependent sugar dehydrogenase [Acidobacteria bacterium]|nr:PQQ-dependent sugar dehydrogenase [Acidobacteriota bacterium]MBV9068889.1 PQQ-dependent sugar dehydrogenase [Acidobacteriota bacterium]MBV9185953.1 PQQ-dependent sugar dehydrogenase [Acidobacteriota bacterium]